MKVRGFLTALCVVSLIGIFVFGITAMAYAKAAPVAEEAKGETAVVEGKMPPVGNVNPTAKGQDKGSPMHAWKAIVDAGKKAGDTITAKEFAGMRNWSASTRGYELRSLVAIGVLTPTGNRGEYKLLVDATSKKIDQINEDAKPIVNKISRDGTETALGIDTWILDTKHLGEGKVLQIAALVKKVTESNATLSPISYEDFVKENIDYSRAVPASVAINDEILFTINELNLTDEGDLVDEPVTKSSIEQRTLLTSLIDARMVSPEATMKGYVADFSAAKVKTVMFKEELLDKPEEFKIEFDKLGQDETAVIVAINKNNGDIKTALEQAGLSEQWGNRIIAMGVKADSPAAQAFGRLFGDKNVIDLRGQPIDNILKNKDLVKGLKGGV